MIDYAEETLLIVGDYIADAIALYQTMTGTTWE